MEKETFGLHLVGCSAGFCLLLLAIRSKHFQSFLQTKPIHWLGKTSFGIYLSHFLMICLVDTCFIRTTASFLHRDVALILGLFLLILPLTGILAYFFYLFVDSPAVTLSHWIYFYIFRRFSRTTKPIRRPPLIQRRIWLVLLSFVLVLLIINSIPGEIGQRHCDDHSSQNTTLILNHFIAS